MTEEIMMRAEESYRRDARFRALAISSVAQAKDEFGLVDPERADDDAVEIATRATILLLQRVFEGDAELFAARHERDLYKQMVADAMVTIPRVGLVRGSDTPR